MIGQKELFMGIAALALLGGAFFYGYHKGTANQIRKFEDDRQQLQTELLDLSEDLHAKNAELLDAQREKEDLINELEQQASDAVGSSNPGIGSTGGLQRLEKRWGPAPATPN